MSLTYDEAFEVIRRVTGEPIGSVQATILATIESNEVRLSSRHPSCDPRDVVRPIYDADGIEIGIKVDGKRADIVHVVSATAVEVIAYVQDPAVRDWPSTLMARLSRERVAEARRSAGGRSRDFVQTFPEALMFDGADLAPWLGKRAAPTDGGVKATVARQAMNEAFPEGPPDQTAMGNAVFIQRVREKLPAAWKVPVDKGGMSDSTILRVGGRKDRAKRAK